MRPHPRSTLFPYPPLFRPLDGPRHVFGLLDQVARRRPAVRERWVGDRSSRPDQVVTDLPREPEVGVAVVVDVRSEEHTSELQSRQYLVCRLLLEKKNQRLKSQLRPRVGGQNMRGPPAPYPRDLCWAARTSRRLASSRADTSYAVASWRCS